MAKKKESKKDTIIKFIQQHYLYFMMYAIFGWCYEIFLEVVIYRWGFCDRGVLFGPYCPVYGFGALLFIFCVRPLIKNKPKRKQLLMIPLVFLLCGIAATLLELFTSYLCEWFTGSWPWQTYSEYAINFQGRIALSPSIRFGIGGVLFLYILQPIFEKLINKLDKKKLNTVFFIVLGLFILDFIIFLI